ncbi:MAG: hypothetical protein FWG02_06005 [Holophagaceae bacterium]|nr:hypothetical protein [Holophagaceae bacterium]
MTITQTVDIPPSHRLTIDVPPEIPAGRVLLTFTPAVTHDLKPMGIEDIRQLLRKEMAERGTSAVTALSEDGWEAHVRERYAES